MSGRFHLLVRGATAHPGILKITVIILVKLHLHTLDYMSCTNTSLIQRFCTQPMLFVSPDTEQALRIQHFSLLYCQHLAFDLFKMNLDYLLPTILHFTQLLSSFYIMSGIKHFFRSHL